MKRTLALLGSILAVAASQAAARQFEGVVKQRSISVEKYALEARGFEMSESIFDTPLERILELREELEASGEMTVSETDTYIKGKLVRMDMESEEGPSYVVLDLARGVMRMVQPSRQKYIEMTKDDMERMAAMTGGASAKGTSPEPRATGESKTINGMQTTAFDVTLDDGMMRAWVSKDNPDLLTAFAALMERVSAMSMEEDGVDLSRLVADYGYPVLTQQLSYDTYEIEETLSVEPQSVSDDLFVTPAGFRKMTMADLMGR